MSFGQYLTWKSLNFELQTRKFELFWGPWCEVKLWASMGLFVKINVFQNFHISSFFWRRKNRFRKYFEQPKKKIVVFFRNWWFWEITPQKCLPTSHHGPKKASKILRWSSNCSLFRVKRWSKLTKYWTFLVSFKTF